jgi:zinc transporter ZupT
MELIATLVAALALALVQVLPRFIPTFEGPRRRNVLSLAAGLSVAFVFLELLPQVRERAEAVAERSGSALGFVRDESFFLTMVGLLVFYGLETLARRTSGEVRTVRDDPVGLTQIAAFALYYGVIGYLLWTQEGDGGASLIPFVAAVGVHFLVVDFGLRAHHPIAYRRVGRWVLAAAVLVGWGIGAVTTLPEGVVGIGIAFLAGGIILITLKEELPKEAEGRYVPFLAGAAACTALLALL